jgi:group II intron reverse transcriptase/maturase
MRQRLEHNLQGEDARAEAKPFEISKQEVVRAYKRVRAKGGSAGVDGVELGEFERDVKNNLYRIWNRLSSGSYIPPPVLRVEIPKEPGKTRPLGIPTVADRIAQTVVAQRLVPVLEPLFHANSYGYRPGRSAHDALRVARQQCWRHDWVLELDIKGFFDNMDWALLLRAVRKHAPQSWQVLYIERWLQAAVVMPDGTVQQRDKGTPQGGVISPVLANLFLHYAFDEWMKRHHPEVPFERYADDMICHCDSQEQAQALRAELEQRLGECGLELHPQKTRVVYCADANRTAVHESPREFDFLGYTFKARSAKNRQGQVFSNFLPAVSAKAQAAMRARMRGWHLVSRSAKSLDEVLQEIGPVVRGWVRYYGAFRPWSLYRALQPLDHHLVRWAKRKYKHLRRRTARAWDWLNGVRSRAPTLFPHWVASILATA